MVSCKIACEDVNDHSIDHSTIFTKTSPDSINPHSGEAPSDFKFSDTKVISFLIVLRSPQRKNLGTRLTGMIEWRQKSIPRGFKHTQPPSPNKKPLDQILSPKNTKMNFAALKFTTAI